MFEFIDASGERITVRSRRTLANLLADGRIAAETLFRSEGQTDFAPARTHAELCSLADEQGVPFAAADDFKLTYQAAPAEDIAPAPQAPKEIATEEIATEEIAAKTIPAGPSMPRLPVQPVVPAFTPASAWVQRPAPAFTPPRRPAIHVRYHAPPSRPFRDGVAGLKAMLQRFFFVAIAGILTWQVVISKTGQQPRAALATLVVCTLAAGCAGRYRASDVRMASRFVRVLASSVFIALGLGVGGWIGCGTALIAAFAHELSLPRRPK